MLHDAIFSSLDESKTITMLSACSKWCGHMINFVIPVCFINCGDCWESVQCYLSNRKAY